MADALGKGKRVLLVEDEQAVQNLVRRALLQHGFEVDIAVDGLDGLVKLEATSFDLIISDIMMPRLDGMTFVQAVKKHTDTRGIPVIFLTARADTRSLIDGISAGARFYITKPFQLDELLDKVMRALKLAA